MRKWIELTDGTIVENAYVVALSDDLIAIYVRGEHTFSEMYALFADNAKTRTMVSHENDDVWTWTGYTVVKTIQTNDREAYISLTK